MKCPEERIAELIEQLEADDALGLVLLDNLLVQYPEDAQLPFLKGSVLAGQGHASEGRKLMTDALQLAPDYDIARFQLGLLELTSGDPAMAESTWDLFRHYPTDHFLRLFVEGLGALIRDDFERSAALLCQGIRENQILPQMNHDMQLVIDQITSHSDDPKAPGEHLLLQIYNSDETRH